MTSGVKSQRFKLDALKKMTAPDYLKDADQAQEFGAEPASVVEAPVPRRRFGQPGQIVSTPKSPKVAPTSPANKINTFSRNIETGRDARVICNTMKSLSSLAISVVRDGEDPDLVVQTCERLAAVMTRKLGIDDGDPKASFAMPIMMEASSAIISSISNEGISSIEFGKKSDEMISMMMGAISRGVHRKIEREWPDDIDASTSMHLVFASAMSSIAIEIAEFCPFKDRDRLMKRIGESIMDKAIAYTAKGVSEESGQNARQTFTLSMISSGARIYSACLKAKFNDLKKFIHQSNSGAQQRLDEVRTRESEIIDSIEHKFFSIFDSTINLAIDQTRSSKKPRTP